MAKIQKNPENYQMLVRMLNSVIAGRNAKWDNHFERQFGGFLTKLNIGLPYDLATVLLGIYPKELKTYIYTKTCTWMFIAGLFIIAKLGSNQDVFSRINKWKNKLVYPGNGILFSATRK